MVGKSKVPPENHWQVSSLTHTAKNHLSYSVLSDPWKQQDKQPMTQVAEHEEAAFCSLLKLRLQLREAGRKYHSPAPFSLFLNMLCPSEAPF